MCSHIFCKTDDGSGDLKKKKNQILKLVLRIIGKFATVCHMSRYWILCVCLCVCCEWIDGMVMFLGHSDWYSPE